MRRISAYCAALALTFAPAAFAQEAEGESLMDVLARAATMDAESQRSGLVSFVENQISTPDRQIRLTNIEGALSSDASIGQITISDTQGIWLLIENAAINWNQGALLFGRLEIRSLSAESITWFRSPVESEQAATPPSPESRGGFSVPELPVAVVLEQLSVPRVTFGEDIFGLGSVISVTGAMTLEGGTIDADLDITRLDGPGGSLALDLAFANETQVVDLDLTLVEPENGIIANLLNIEDRPEIALGLSGAGPITELAVDLTFDADNQRILSGTGAVNQTAAGLAIDGRLFGPLADILPAAYEEFFGTETALDFALLMREEGGFSLESFALSGGQLALTASATTSIDGFLNRLLIDGRIAAADGAPVTLPVPGAATRLDRAQFAVDFGADGGDDWSGALTIEGFATPDFAVDTIGLEASGVAVNLDDASSRRITFNGEGGARGLQSRSDDIQAALGDSIGLGIAGLWQAEQPITLAQFRLIGQALVLELAGEIAQGVFDGDIALATGSLAPFSGLAGRDLSGSITLNATGTVSATTGGFDLLLDGDADNLTIGDETADRLLAGPANLSGRIARSGDGLTAEGFRLGNDNIVLTADGTYATGAADFRFDLALADLALIAEDVSGRLTATGTARGADGRIALNLDASVPQGSLAGRPLRDAALRFEGLSAEAGLTGTVSGSTMLDGHRIALGTGIDQNAERLILSDIRFTAPGTTLGGNLTRLADGLMDGQLTLDAPNIETAAALALARASGAVNAEIALSSTGGEQGATIDARVNALRFNDISVSNASVQGTIADLFGVPVIAGAVTGNGIVAAGVRADAIDLTASSSGDTTRFDGSATLNGNTDVALAGSLSPLDDGFRVALDSFNLVQGALAARLAAPTALTVAGETVSFSGVEFAVGSGRITATGSAGQALDIALTVNALPLDIANTIVPGLGLAGTISGAAQISGSAADPRASFSVQGQGLNAAAIAEFGIAPLSLSAEGSFANNTVLLNAGQASGSGGLSASFSGRIPLAGSGLDLTVNGSAPLSLANRFVADRGAQVSGNATANARLSGSLDNPQFSGTVSVANGEYVDPELALRLVGITGSGQLSADRLTISSLSAQLATGGSLSVGGYLGLDSQLTSNLTVTLNNARYADGNLVVATLNGALALSGPITGAGQLSGRIDVARADITLPEGGGGAGALLDVDHRNPPQGVSQTLARARVDERASSAPSAGPGLGLDVTINAPNQVFIRGRGLDAEVGGALRITGSVNQVIPVGALELIRGRMDIIGQRINFTSGNVTLIGDLDPFIDLVATTSGQDILVIVSVTGRASAPEISFSSQPQLPEDEVLARLIFNRGTGDLSPFQLVQLAVAAAELAGGGNTSLVGSLRQAAGLDDLDIVTDAEGNAAVRAGRYIDDNIYLGVEAGSAGQSRVTIDLDITDNLTARGAAGSDGNTSLGIFYEQDY